MKKLNLDYRTFLITFNFGLSNKKHLFQDGKSLVNILEGANDGGIKSIQELTDKNTFKRVSKETILNCFSWDTETMEYLKKHYYFTKK